MFYVECIEQPLRITDSLAIDEPVNINTCTKWEGFWNISPSWRGKRHFVCLPNILSQVLCLSSRTKQLQNNFISSFLALLYSVGYRCMTHTYTQLSYLACQWQELLALCPYLLFLGLQNTIPKSEKYKYIYVYL